jgi:hypothetical protein
LQILRYDFGIANPEELVTNPEEQELAAFPEELVANPEEQDSGLFAIS